MAEDGWMDVSLLQVVCKWCGSIVIQNVYFVLQIFKMWMWGKSSVSLFLNPQHWVHFKVVIKWKSFIKHILRWSYWPGQLLVKILFWFQPWHIWLGCGEMWTLWRNLWYYIHLWALIQSVKNEKTALNISSNTRGLSGVCLGN